MGVSTNYLGHVEIVPSLNQAEYDYLRAFARGRRSYRPGGPYAVSPEDPHTGSSQREVERYNRIAEGQPGYWCQWVPCPHGCCLAWNGHEKSMQVRLGCSTSLIIFCGAMHARRPAVVPSSLASRSITRWMG
jgi:hypothetical protein